MGRGGGGGYKLWCKAGVSGYIYDFTQGKKAKGAPDDVPDGDSYGETECVILRLTKNLEPSKHKVFFDNLFSTPVLMEYLKIRGVYAVATLRADRSRGCPIPTESELKKQGRGHIEQFVDTRSGLVVCAWYDNRRILTLSNYVGKVPVDQAKRWDRKGKQEVKIARPASVATYNKFIGGVDKCDMFLALYRTKLKTRKWYHRIAIHLLSVSVLNAFVIYKKVGGKESLLHFLMDVCRSLCASVDEQSDSDSDGPLDLTRRRSLSAKDVPNHVRYDRRNHWPIQHMDSQTCKEDGCKR